MGITILVVLSFGRSDEARSSTLAALKYLTDYLGNSKQGGIFAILGGKKKPWIG